MPITQSIQEARKRGVADDQILNEIMKQNPAKTQVFQEAQKRGADASQILNEVIKQNTGSFGSFLKGEIAGGAKESEKPTGEVARFATDVIQETIGSKGLLGVAQMPGKVIEAGVKTIDQKMLGETSNNLSNLTAQLVMKRNALPEGEKRTKLDKIIKDNFSQLDQIKDIFMEQEKEIITPRQAISTAGRAAATAVGGGGKTIAQQVVRSAIAGAGYGVSGGIEEEATPSELLARGAIGGIVGGAIPIVTKVGNAIIQKVVVKPVKGMTKAVSQFFFGPEGTSGFGVRFEDPTLSGFLKTARRQEGGTKFEDITTMLHGAVKGVRDKMKNEFVKAEEQMVEKPVVRKTITGTMESIIKDFLKINQATQKAVERSGLDDTQIKVVNRILTEVEKIPKSPTTKDILTTKRIIDNLYRGTKSTKQSDAIVSKITRYLSSTIEAVDKNFAKASEMYAKDSKFLSLIQKNILGTTKESVEQTANNLFSIAKSIEDPFKKQETEKLLTELSKRSGVDFMKILKALSAAVNLSPQQAQGLRAGIVRELARILQTGISEGVGFAGTIAKKIPKVPENILETLRTGMGSVGRVGAIKGIEELFNK